jgi:hypothetical protein
VKVKLSERCSDQLIDILPRLKATTVKNIVFVNSNENVIVIHFPRKFHKDTLPQTLCLLPDTVDLCPSSSIISPNSSLSSGVGNVARNMMVVVVVDLQ